MDSELAAADKPQAVWLDNDVDEYAAFDDPSWEKIDPGPVLGREQAAQWLVRRDQRLEAARMRLSGSTQPRPPVVHVPERREPETRPRKRRARSRSTAPTRGPPDDPGELPQRLSADERRELKKRIDARRRELVAAPEQADKVERSLERHWREDAA
jgi:hypothetical protein